MKPSEILEEKNRKIVSERVYTLNKNIRKLIRYAQSYIKTFDPVVELNFEEVTITEFRCEQCGSVDVHDVNSQSDENTDATDIGFECEEGHYTQVRTERY